MIAEQTPSAPQPVAQHPLADHCLFHLLGDIVHPAGVATVQHIKVKLSWPNDAVRPIAALDSPFKPPRV